MSYDQRDRQNWRRSSSGGGNNQPRGGAYNQSRGGQYRDDNQQRRQSNPRQQQQRHNGQSGQWNSGNYPQHENGQQQRRQSDNYYPHDNGQYNQQRQQNRYQPYSTHRGNHHQQNQFQPHDAFQVNPYPGMDAPLVQPFFLPPPPIPPPNFGTGNRSFNDYSFQSSYADTSGSSWRDTTLTLDADPRANVTLGNSSDDAIVIEDDDARSDEGDPDDADDDHKAVQKELHRLLNLDRDEVPEYVLRMREMGPHGYPPALIDEHIRARDSLPLFGDNIDTLLPKRELNTDKLPAFRGFTHLSGSSVSPEFAALMRQLADIDYDLSHEEALERSGLDESKSPKKSDEPSAAKRRKTEVIHYEIPEYEVATTNDYQFANDTKAMKHTLESFADGIQPFQNSHVNKPTHFMSKLKSILDKNKESPASTLSTGSPSTSEAK